MPEQQRTYIAIDLKSFYASVECVDRGLDPLTTNLVVADESRTDKTICLAVSPSLKAYGIGGRARLFEVKQKARGVNFIIAKPRMAHYIEVSTKIYGIYLKYIAQEDIHVYSIDEVFMDVTAYLGSYKMTAHQLAMKMIRDVLSQTGITATAGIGTNMYLCKVAMDIMAKKAPADKDGVRIAELDEMTYRRELWSHRPLTSFWQLGRGIAERLEHCYLNNGRGIFTMGDLARVSVKNPDALYKMFGVNAEILIDHAWGYEPCGIAEIKRYKSKTHSIGGGQVLSCAYDSAKAKIVIREMVDTLALDLVEKGLVTNGLTLHVGYDRENVDKGIYHGETVVDGYGRTIPKPAHGTAPLLNYTSSASTIAEAVMKLADRIMNPQLTVKRLNLTANNVLSATQESYDLFTDVKKVEREKKMMLAQIAIKKRFGKNAIFKGMDMQEGATTRERNEQIGGHKA